jgi:Domain of unknown function (DUF5615)
VSEQLTLLKFYTDANIAKAIAVQLRNRGVDIVRCEDVGMVKADDYQHLEYATVHGRTMITGDTDFLRIHGEWQIAGRSHNGIMFIQDHLQGDKGIGVIVRDLILYHELVVNGAATVKDDIANQVLYVR